MNISEEQKTIGHWEDACRLELTAMRLTNWTDYSLRVLMYCAASAQREQPATISEIAVKRTASRAATSPRS
jgi:hypothetical protein